MKKHHTRSFLKVILIKKGRKRFFSLCICILNVNNIIKSKLGFFTYRKFANKIYDKLSNGTSNVFFLNYFLCKNWMIKSLKFSYKTSLLFRILNII